MASGLHQRPALQGGARSAHRSGTHHRDRLGVLPLPQNLAQEDERVSLGVRFCFRYALPDTLPQNRTTSKSDRTSSRPARSPTASAEPCARRRKSKPGCSVLLPLRPPGYAPAEPSTLNINVPRGGPKQTAEVGQAKLPKSPGCRWGSPDHFQLHEER